MAKVREPGTSIEGSAPGYMAGSGARSATVVYPVSATNSLNCPAVTACRSIQNPPTSIRPVGASSG
jgi:hypothetical protein